MREATAVIMKRDNLTLEKADRIVQKAKNRAMRLIEKGNYFEAENAWEKATGLEADYLFNLV